MQKGRIIKSLSGFYYVLNENGVYQCKGRGVFRKRKITPLVGDLVTFDLDENKEGYITEIESRENKMIRPPIANVDQAIIVSSAKKPNFNSKLLDRFLVKIESIGLKPVILLTKMDLATQEERQEIKQYETYYKSIGYECQLISAKNDTKHDYLLDYFPSKITIIAGQSGVGKSSLLNLLMPSLDLKTGDISESLGRGKHTTRHVELLQINNGLVADTPGFSSLDFDNIEQETLSFCFPEMRERENQCKFRGCLHNKEPKCAVKTAVEEGHIINKRYEHYLEFLEEIQTRKPRYD